MKSYLLGWALLGRVVIDSDGFESSRRQLWGEGLGGLFVPIPDWHSDLGLDFLHQANRDQFSATFWAAPPLSFGVVAKQ